MKKELIGLVKKNKDVIIVAGAIGTVLGHKIGYFRATWASASLMTRKEKEKEAEIEINRLEAKIEINRLEEIIKKQEEHISDLIKGQ